ncbi:MAG: QueT transporter family protein [Bacilli bacterium]|nr:QueT transporter family protein [Bacilli bacterium]
MEAKTSRFSDWCKKYFTVSSIAFNAIIAALYAVVTLLSAPLSYNFMQFRISELLNLLVFFNPTYTIGLTLGCLIANLASTAGIFDIVFGTLATLISCVIVSVLCRWVKCLFLSGLIPCLVNAIIVPFVIYLASLNTPDAFALGTMYWTMFFWVFLGEFAVICVAGYPIFFALTKKVPKMNELLVLTRNLDFKW